MKMKLCLAAALLIATSAWATPLATYTHNYGSDSGYVSPTSLGSSTLKPTYVQVNDTLPNFSDSFAFTSLSFDSIASFVLTLTYSGIDSKAKNELWWSASGASTTDTYSSQLSSSGSTVVTITSAIDSSVFKSLVDAKSFTFGLSESTGGPDTFKLSSASLTLNGVTASAAAPTAAVPEPASLALLGLGLAGIGGLRRRRQGA